MKPDTVAKWLEQSADAPPPPTHPSALPIADDSVSTVYPESSVSNPYASRYTGMKHRRPSPVPAPRGSYPPPAYRPTSAQGHYRERERLHPMTPVPPPAPPRIRSRSLSAETYMPAEAKPMSYSYPPPKPSPTKGVPPMYYAPVAPAAPIPHHSSRSPSRGASRSPVPTAGYRGVSASSQRVEPPRAKSPHQYVTYTTYHSTPALSSTPPSKKPHFFQRLFGIEWGSSPKREEVPRSSSRSSSKTKSYSNSRSSDHSSGTRPSRGRTPSDGNVVYVRY